MILITKQNWERGRTVLAHIAKGIFSRYDWKPRIGQFSFLGACIFPSPVSPNQPICQDPICGYAFADPLDGIGERYVC